MNLLDGKTSTLGIRSIDRLVEVEPELAEIIIEASKWMDITVICGHRDQAAQKAAFEGGFSSKIWPTSKHNKIPSSAVDVAPYDDGIDWQDINEFKRMVNLIKLVAEKKNISIRCGADFNSFKDYPHIELV